MPRNSPLQREGLEQMSPDIIRHLISTSSIDLSAIREFSSSTKGFFAIFNRSSAESITHIRAALEHARRPRKTKIRDQTALFMMFLSGEMQISSAFGKAGITDKTREMTMVCESDEDFEKFLEVFPTVSVDPSATIPEDLPEKDSEIFPSMALLELHLS